MSERSKNPFQMKPEFSLSEVKILSGVRDCCAKKVFEI